MKTETLYFQPTHDVLSKVEKPLLPNSVFGRASLPELPDQAEVQETNRIASRSAPSRAGRAPHYDFFIQRSSNPDSQKMSAPFNDFCASQAFSVKSITTI
jgi:hypothetical protein